MTPEEYQALRTRSATMRRLNQDIQSTTNFVTNHPGSIKGHSRLASLSKRKASLTKISKRRQLTLRFEVIWAALEGPELRKEAAFHPTRKWALDYLHEATHVAIEINGGQWARGNSGHSSGTGLQRDAEKANAAVLCGYSLFTLTTSMVNGQHIKPIIDHIRKREKFLSDNL